MSLYRVPSNFQQRLEEEFGDRLRVRWSNEREEWHVEQKVRRGLAGFPQDSESNRFSDDLIRYADGYIWVMSIKQGSRFSCHKCHLPLTAPTREWKMVSCEHCRLKGYDHQRLAGHWPFDETLIEKLKELEKSIDDMGRKANQKNALLQKQQLRQARQDTIDAHLDDFNRIVGIPSVGYTGKVFTGA